MIREAESCRIVYYRWEKLGSGQQTLDPYLPFSLLLPPTPITRSVHVHRSTAAGKPGVAPLHHVANDRVSDPALFLRLSFSANIGSWNIQRY